jgi:hypothetical protein
MLFIEEYIMPGPPISLVYPSAGHQSAKVRVFSDFAADLMLRWNDTVRRWIAQPPAPSRVPHRLTDRLPAKLGEEP